MLRFGSYLLWFHLASDWSRNNKHSRNFLWCSRFYGNDCNYNLCNQKNCRYCVYSATCSCSRMKGENKEWVWMANLQFWRCFIATHALVWYLGTPKEKSCISPNVMSHWNVWIRVFVDSGLRNFLIWWILYNPWKALLQVLPMLMNVDVLESNHEPKLRTLLSSSAGWVSVKWGPDGGGWRMADDKMRIEKCGW